MAFLLCLWKHLHFVHKKILTAIDKDLLICYNFIILG